MRAHATRAFRWTVRLLVGCGLLLALAAAVVWWWAGQEGSLQTVLERIGGRVPLHSEGVQGSFRGPWHIARITWERDGIRVEAEDIRLEWQPLALLEQTLRLEQLAVARVQVTDTRPVKDTPLPEPANLLLPWQVDVQRLQVGSLSYQGRVQFAGSGLDAQYAYDGRRHHVELAGLHLAGGDYRGRMVVQARAPLTLGASVAGRFAAPVPGVAEPVPLSFDLQAQGPARAIGVRALLQVRRGARARGDLPEATVKAEIHPFERMPVQQALADFRQLDAHLFRPDAPHTLLSGHVQLQPETKARFALQADVRNAAAGPWDAQRLPVSAVQLTGEWRDGQALLQSLAADAAGGHVSGSGKWRDHGWTFEGRVADVDPAKLHTRLAALPLSGPIQLAGEGQRVDFDVDLRARAAHAAGAHGLAAEAAALQLRDLLAQGRWSGTVLSLSQLQLHTDDASLEGAGEWESAGRAGSGHLQLHAPGVDAKAQGQLAATSGRGSLELSARDLAQVRHWLARWPGSAAWLPPPALRGQARVQLSWQGGWRDPTVQALAHGQALAWQPAGNAQADAPLPWVVREASLQVNGRLHDAALDVHLQGDQGQRRIDLLAAGRVGAADLAHWHGQVASLALQLQDPGIAPGPWQLRLQQAVDWRVAGSDLEVGAGSAALHAPSLPSGGAATDARVAWSPLRRDHGVLSTAGTVSGLPLAWLQFAGGSQLQALALSGDLVFDGQWNAQLGSTVRIDASLARVRGDVNVLAETADGSSARVPAGVREARLSVSARGEQVEAHLLWDSEHAGHADGQLRSRLVRASDGSWSWPAQAPLAGRVQAELPRIGVWSVLAPPGWRLRGSVSADVRIAGTRAQPELSGPVNADDLAVRSVVDGVGLRNGRLRARLAGQRVIVDEFLLHGIGEAGGDGGTLVAHGEGQWTPQGPVFSAEAVLSQLRASIRSDRQLTVSGTVQARVEQGASSVTGALKVDRARITIPEESPPKLAEDVVVHNAPGLPESYAERRQSGSRTAQPMHLTLRMHFDLGPDFRLSGRGLDARLAGSVEITNNPDGTPQIVGVIHAVDGTFFAYGQRMKIERGELRFTGAPDNPALDVLAIRPNLTVKVGVQVTGRAQSPHVELYSDAGLSDAETLSYVVLGRSSSGGGAETALLQRAATALLAGKSGSGKGLAGSLGLDDLSVSPDGTSGAVVRVGKRFAKDFYASYERSLSGAMGTLFLFYDVSRRVTVRAEAGERTGLDLILTFYFGEPKKK
ncbi:translocation/assembly module TamB domain-containing protein [Ramlibacter ginsenosidimutans]|uniref:Translocation/assembly module TamB domain-containing protein n=1 Tax=Ramlibacter ginsenosidimutans TaxID=502333 RepID=A0A934WPY4_9BURK|nr:translocation/assembly module TamB domain-containing protein [Ramlibacter ginsenosidimutans]MBK6008855.1 translocation/assembly module TamB domain-containing protein [Ramlibacter ginsenosidimutans]